MPSSDPQRPPDLDREATTAMDDRARAVLRGALRDRHGEHLDVDGAKGERAAWIVCEVDEGRRVHEITVFSRGDNAEEAHDRCVDYLDGTLAEMVEGSFLPLDFEGRPFDDGVVFVRGELRDFAAEREAAALLEEEPPQRRLRKG
jgi:hypothetical protein